MIPKCEPVPFKAMVLEDLGGDLPPEMTTVATTYASSSTSKGEEEEEEEDDASRESYGLVVRTKPGRLDRDVSLKLRVANGTHTAVSQVMALCSLPSTDALSSSSLSSSAAASSREGGGEEDGTPGTVLMEYLDALFEDQILPAAIWDMKKKSSSSYEGEEEEEEEGEGEEKDEEKGDDEEREREVRAVWEDWRRSLTHPHFGLGTFFIAQNCAAKGGIFKACL